MIRQIYFFFTQMYLFLKQQEKIGVSSKQVLKHLSCSNALEIPSGPWFYLLLAEIFWKLLPCIAYSKSHCWAVLQQGFLHPTLTSKATACLDLPLQNVPKDTSPCTAPGEIPPQTAMINAYTISFPSENGFFWFPNKQQKKDGTSCSPARGTEGADLVSLRHSHNREGEYKFGWLSLHRHFIHALRTPLPSS